VARAAVIKHGSRPREIAPRRRGGGRETERERETDRQRERARERIQSRSTCPREMKRVPLGIVC